MSDRDDALSLLKEHRAEAVREAKHGTIYRFPSGRTLLIHHEGRANEDPNAWAAVLRDIRKILDQDKRLKEELKVNTQHPVAAPNYPGPANRQPIAGMSVSTKTQRIVMEELTSSLEIAPHQLHALLRHGGISVPDDAKVTFTNQGYVRVTWTQTKESTEA